MLEVITLVPKDEQRRVALQILDTYEHHLLHKEVVLAERAFMDVHELLGYLKHNGVRYKLGDNIHDLVKGLITQIRRDPDAKTRKVRTPPMNILGAIAVAKKVKHTNNKHKQYTLLTEYLEQCGPVQARWFINILTDQERIREIPIWEEQKKKQKT